MTRQIPTISSPVEGMPWLDRLAEPLQKAAHAVFRANGTTQKAKDWFNGTPIRHRVHPALIIWPLGAWTTAAFFDALDAFSGDDDHAASADLAVLFGIIGAVPAAVAGVADWVDTYDQHRRVGMAHATLNTAALALYGVSYALRRAERRGAARGLAWLSFGVVSLSGMLGGELAYNLGVNVNHLLYPKPPDTFVDVLAAAELPEREPTVVEVERVPVLLYRAGGEITAVEAWCPHAGGPLAEGEFRDGEVECPWHGSRFCLSDGRPTQGPASSPLRTFDVEERNGRIFVRPSYEGQTWPPPPALPQRAAATAG